MHETYSLHKDGGFANELNQLEDFTMSVKADWTKLPLKILIPCRHIATCKPGKPELTSFSETLAFFFIQFLSFREMKVQDRQNCPSGLTEKTGWLRACLELVLLRQLQFTQWKLS